MLPRCLEAELANLPVSQGGEESYCSIKSDIRVNGSIIVLCGVLDFQRGQKRLFGVISSRPPRLLRLTALVGLPIIAPRAQLNKMPPTMGK